MTASLHCVALQRCQLRAQPGVHALPPWRLGVGARAMGQSAPAPHLQRGELGLQALLQLLHAGSAPRHHLKQGLRGGTRTGCCRPWEHGSQVSVAACTFCSATPPNTAVPTLQHNSGIPFEPVAGIQQLDPASTHLNLLVLSLAPQRVGRVIDVFGRRTLLMDCLLQQHPRRLAHRRLCHLHSPATGADSPQLGVLHSCCILGAAFLASR